MTIHCMVLKHYMLELILVHAHIITNIAWYVKQHITNTAWYVM